MKKYDIERLRRLAQDHQTIARRELDEIKAKIEKQTISVPHPYVDTSNVIDLIYFGKKLSEYNQLNIIINDPSYYEDEDEMNKRINDEISRYTGYIISKHFRRGTNTTYNMKENIDESATLHAMSDVLNTIEKCEL